MKRGKRTVLFQGVQRLPEEIAQLTGHKVTTITSRIKTTGWDPKMDFTEKLSRPKSGGGVTATHYIYGGMRRTVKAIAKRSGKSTSYLYDLIAKLRKMQPERLEQDLLLIIHSLEFRVCRVYAYRGKQYSSSEIANIIQIPPERIKQMRRKGYSVEETVMLEKGL